MRFHSLPPGAAFTLLLTVCLIASSSSGWTADSAATTGQKSDASLPVSASDKNSAAIEDSVVKIFTTRRLPDFYKPWTKQSPDEVTGSGVVIEGRRILTNAHVVEHASEVQIQANQAGDKIYATVEAIAPGIDLAILKLDDDNFFDTHPPLRRAQTLPAVKDTVLTYGYPEGGTSLSITKGIVSRVEFDLYHFPVSGLRIQVDAAINPGNSGGPAMVGDKMIGLTFSRLLEADNIGYIIPSEEIDLFLQGVASGHYDGKPSFFEDLQTLENPTLRTFLKLPPAVHGMVVSRPGQADAGDPLKTWDVITKIGDWPVDDVGMIKTDGGLRVQFRYAIQKIARHGKVPLTVVRRSRELKIDMPVTANYPPLIPSVGNGYPLYFIYGPLVFSEATEEYLSGFIRSKYGASLLARFSAADSPLVTRMVDRTRFDGERLVIVAAPFFPHKLAEGYGNPASLVVKSVNGTPIKNLAHLVAVLRDCKDQYVTFEYWGHQGENMIFPRAQMVAATDDILSDNGVRAQGSADLLNIWNLKTK